MTEDIIGRQFFEPKRDEDKRLWDARAAGLREGSTAADLLEAEVRRLRAERAVLGQEVDRLQTMACGAVDAARDAEADVARLTAELDGLRAQITSLPRYDPDQCDRLGTCADMIEEPEGDWISRDAVLHVFENLTKHQKTAV